MQRHQEVLAAVSGSENRAEATSAIQSLLGVDEFQASWILSLRWDQVTRDEVRALAENIARQAAFLELESPGADS